MIARAMNRSVNSAAMLFTLAALFASGCSSSAPDQSQRLVTSIDQLQTRGMITRAQVDRTMDSLNALQTSKDIRTDFQVFSDNVDEVGKQAKEIQDLAGDMKNRMETYIEKWQQDTSKTTDASLKSISEQRRLAVKQRFIEVQGAQQGLATAYKSFHGDITSLRVYLANDLTSGALDAAAPIIKKTNADRAEMKKYGTQLFAILEQVSAGMTSTTAPSASPDSK